MLQRTTAQRKIASLKKRIRVIKGGTSASKTYSILPFLADYAIKTPNTEISVVAESIPHIKRGAHRDFINILKMIGFYQKSQHNLSNLTYTFQNDSFIEFFSADNHDKLHGARRDVLFMNECNNMSFYAYHQLSIRTRKFIYLDYNPVAPFWVDTELIGDEDVQNLTLTYKDNEALEPAIIKEIEKAKNKAKTSTYWANWWRVYGLGQTGRLEGVIFDNWQPIDSIDKEAVLLGYGLDFGYSNDPTALIAVYKLDNTLILDEVLYTKGLLNSSIANKLKTLEKKIVYADSAEPKSIAEIKQHGITIKGVTKGKDSILFGINIMQQQNFKVTKRSTNLIKELRYYCWDKDKDGTTLNKPTGEADHAIDATRYFCMMYFSKGSNYGKYFVQ